jgi:hypothetical protein
MKSLLIAVVIVVACAATCYMALQAKKSFTATQESYAASIEKVLQDK